MDQQRISQAFQSIVMVSDNPADIEERFFEQLDAIDFGLKHTATRIWHRHMRQADDHLSDLESHIMAEATKAIVRWHMGEHWAQVYMATGAETVH